MPQGTLTMYLPHVFERWERSTGVAARTIKPTLESAKAVLDAELERAGKPALDWHDEFGGASADQGDLVYAVQAVEVSFRE